MKGVNVIILNQATMIEALQEYFDNRIDPKIEVTVVKTVSDSYISDFKVCVKEPESRPE